MRVTDHGSFWNWLGTDDGDLPIHLPIGVNAAGQGPVSDATAHHFVCWCGDVECPLTHVLALADARVRADERKRWGLGWVAAADNVQALAHAEAVAARLVEVIRVDDLRLRTQKGHTAQARRERDAARADVAALRKQEWAEPYRREVLADLRAKVEGLEHDATCSFIPQDGPCDCVRGAVLALIEEAQS